MSKGPAGERGATPAARSEGARGVAWRIREASAKDVAALARLVSAFDRLPVEPATMAMRLSAVRQTESVFIAERDQPIGFCSMHLRPSLTADHPYAELTELYVVPEWRRRGVATSLVQRAETFAMQRRARDVVLLTGFRNSEAQAFYRATGYGDYCLAMRKRPLGKG